MVTVFDFIFMRFYGNLIQLFPAYQGFLIFFPPCTNNFSSVTDSESFFLPVASFVFPLLLSSKQRTMADLRSPPRFAYTSNGFDGLSWLSRFSLISLSTILQSWKMTKWQKSWVWCPCSGAPPPSGLTSQVREPADAGRRVGSSSWKAAGSVWRNESFHCQAFESFAAFSCCLIFILIKLFL